MHTISFTDADLTALPGFELFGDPKSEQPRDRFYQLAPVTDLADGTHPQIVCPPDWGCDGIEHYYGQHFAHFRPVTNSMLIRLSRHEIVKLPGPDDPGGNVRYYRVARVDQYPDDPPPHEFVLPTGWRHDRTTAGPRSWWAVLVRADVPEDNY